MINSGDTAWVLIATALVFFMMPGLALFYGGLVGGKDVVATMAQSYVAIGVVSLFWVLLGYSLAFGNDHWGIIGGFSNVMLRGVGSTPNSFAPHIPALLFMAFQMMFAVITPALIAGAFAERMHFRGYLVFIGLWSLVVYCPFAHWVWGGGFLGRKVWGPSTSPGSSSTSWPGLRPGLGALPRTASPDRQALQRAVRPSRGRHLVVRMVWFQRRQRGECRLGGRLSARQHTARRLRGHGGLDDRRVDPSRKPSGLGIASGAVAGLAAITPASGYVPSWAALVIGAGAGLLCYGAVQLKNVLHYDDALDVVGVHMVGGFIGVVLTGVFASLVVNAAGVRGAGYSSAAKRSWP